MAVEAKKVIFVYWA